MAERYENTQGGANKFWEIELHETEILTQYGKIGGKPQETKKSFTNKTQAQKEYQKLVQEKTKKGYVLVSGSNSSAPFSPSSTPSGSMVNTELEYCLSLDPTNERIFQEYATWWQRNGDIRGEIAQLEKKSDTKKLTALLKNEGKSVTSQFHNVHHFFDVPERNIPPMGTDEGNRPWQECYETTFYWHQGWIRSAILSLFSESDCWNGSCDDVPEEGFGKTKYLPETDSEYFLYDFSQLKAAQFTRFLTLGFFDECSDREQSYEPVLNCLAAVAKRNFLPQHLEGLFLGHYHNDQCELSWMKLGDAGILSGLFPKLRTLIIKCGEIFCSRLEFPELRKLIFITGGLPKKALEGLRQHHCPKLQHLELYLGNENYGRSVTPDDLDFILKGGVPFQHLTYLGIKNCEVEIQEKIIEKIVDAPILAQLEVLDLSLGTISDEEAKILLKHAQKFAHLKYLDLSENYLNHTIKNFEKFPCKVSTAPKEEGFERFDENGEEYEDERYTSLGE